MITVLEDEAKCTGCSACYSICPEKCIMMKIDPEGFQYPSINEAKCVNCDKCRKTCPVINSHFVPRSEFPEAVMAYSKDMSTRLDAASGGLFTTIAFIFMQRFNGIVVGARYSDDLKVEHAIATTCDEIKRFSKSKYVQSDLKNVFEDIKIYLQKKRYVLFSGTPCQVYGLKSYLGKEYQHLFCIDVVCHGVPSPAVFRKYLEYKEMINGKIIQFVPRDKKLLHNAYRIGTRIIYSSGKNEYISSDFDLFSRAFFSGACSRLSCSDCQFKTIWHISDLTIGDCWYSKEFLGESDIAGYSLAFIQSEKGKELLRLCGSYVNTHSVNGEQAVKANGGLLYLSAKLNHNRAAFIQDVGKALPFDETVSKYLGKNVHSVFKEAAKSIPGVYSIFRERSLKNEFRRRQHRVIPEQALGIMELNNYKM